MKKILCVWTLLLTSPVFADDEYDISNLQALDEVLFSKDVWKKSLAEIKKTYDKEGKKGSKKIELTDKQKKKLKKGEKIEIDTENFRTKEAFKWLSSAKNGLRAPDENFSLLGKKVGEVVVRGEKGRAVKASVSIYNRGDDKDIRKTTYHDLLTNWKSALDEKLGVRSESRNKSGVVKMTGWIWRKGDVAYLLEGSMTRKTNKAEFVRLRMASAAASREKARTKSRRSLVGNVEKNGKGDVMVGGLPMVDQGKKGYCVVASVERVARYYGLDVDQHELAQLAGTTASGGTSGDGMDKAFKKITGKIHVKTLKLMDYNYKQVVRDYKSYNRAAKKAGAKVFDVDLDNYYLNPLFFWRELDTEVFKAVKTKQAKYNFFKNKVKEFVDRGVPICWTLQLGMFPEKGLPQSWGGHMRIIHGYNTESEEILYTDSWGDGHELKRMPAIEGWCMTMGLYAMVPTN